MSNDAIPVQDQIGSTDKLQTMDDGVTIRARAAHRLLQITAALGLESGHFERTKEPAQRMRIGADDHIREVENQRALDAFSSISDPNVREHLLTLLESLGDKAAP